MKQRFKPERVNAPNLVVVTDESAALASPVPFVVKTLAEWGPNLPIGVAMSGAARVRPFRVRPFKMKQEKALAALRDDAKGNSIGTFVADALALMLQTVGPHNFDNMKDGERQLTVNQLSMPDVLYLYLYLRYDALGDEPVVMLVRCPSCTTEYRWYGDLGSMNVRVVPDDKSELTRSYQLRDPMQFRGKTVSTLKLGLIKWDVFSRPEFQQRGSMQNATIAASIVGMEGIDAIPGTFMVTNDDLDDMTKFDMSGLIGDIESHTPGPQLDVEPECPSCQHKQRMMLDWSWDSFFARSARPSTSTL